MTQQVDSGMDYIMFPVITLIVTIIMGGTNTSGVISRCFACVRGRRNAQEVRASQLFIR